MSPVVARRAAAGRAQRALVLALSVAPLPHLPLIAQQQAARAADSPQRALLASERYVTPSAEIERLVTAPRHRNVTLSNPSPTRRHLLWVQTEPLATAAAFGKAHDNLAGLQVDTRANRARALTTRGAVGLVIVEAATGRQIPVQLPQGATASGPQWSPDGGQLAFLANFDAASYLYVADAASGRARRVSARPVLATLVTAPEWTGDGKLVAVLLPERRMAPPREPDVATGPKVRLTTPGAKNRTRTYADLLEWPYERDLVEYHTTGQLAVIDPRGGGVQNVGVPAMVQAADPSPDGKYVRVTLLQKPFSYAVPVSAFGTVEQLWDLGGRVVAELARRPLREGDQDQGAGGNQAGGRAANDTARRSIGWMPNGDGLHYLQQEPAPREATRGAQPAADADSTEGDARSASRRKDRLFHWRAPFAAGSAKALVESNNHITDVVFSEDGQLVAVAENASGTGHVYAVDLREPAKRMTLVRMRGLNASVARAAQPVGGGGRGTGPDDSTAFYTNPGELATRRGRAGVPVIVRSTDGRSVFFEGTRHFPNPQEQAPRSFVDRVELATGAKTRLFESAAGEVFEDVQWPLDDDYARVVVTRESATSVPDAYVRDLASGQLTRLTRNTDFAPEIAGAQRKLIPVTRADGYRFWVTVTLPKGHTAGTRLPAMVWFYPYEYPDQSAYDRSKRTLNKNRFPTLGPRSMDYLVTQGYAVVTPDAPIFGPQGRMNDNYVSDLRNNLAAVIDELDRLGYIDRQRLGIGGHSYGAFSTVNAMVHTPFFRAGIAGDGNYNRTLTPNTFQSERRDLWEARETYLSMSPILYADRLTGALLMYHGLEDQNVGTDPQNSIRLFHALQGMGKTAALYMYPYEDHGPATRETLLDMWARWTAWLDLYVKNAGKGSAEKVAIVP